MQHEPDKWIKNYEADGYLVVEDCLSGDTLARVRKAADILARDAENFSPGLKRHIQFERDYYQHQPQYNTDVDPAQIGSALRNVMELPMFDPVFAKLIVHDPLLDVLEVLFGSSEFHFHNYKMITKAPRVSSVFRWHRDLPYLQHTTPNLITAMLCLDPMTKANGATVVLPGTHRIPHEKVLASDVEIPQDKLPADAKHVTVECPAGSLVLFHVNIIHGGGPNRSEIPRRNVIGIWAGPDTYPIGPSRYVYQGIYPRSKDPAKQKQVQLAMYGDWKGE